MTGLPAAITLLVVLPPLLGPFSVHARLNPINISKRDQTGSQKSTEYSLKLSF